MADGNEPAAAGRPRQVTDQQVFDALAESIGIDGPHGWTLDGVAARLGITGPALGYRYGNKRGLLLAFASHQPTATAQHFDAVAASTSNPRAAIIESLVGLLSAIATRSEIANHVAMLSVDLSDHELAEHARAQARVIKTKLAEMVERSGARANRIATDAAAEYLYVVWSGAITAWALDGDGDLADAIRDALDLCLEHLGL